MAVGHINAYNEIDLIEKIGEGTYGEVFRAEWKGKQVAAKQLKKHIFEIHVRSKIGERFKSECQLLEQTKHPNIVTFYTVIALQYQPPVIVTELLECDLQKFLCQSTTEPRVDLPHTVQIMLDVAEGLNYLHQHDIVHRDLASKNILLTQERRAKIADLGVAKAFESYSMMATAEPGTPLYAAPETYSVNPFKKKTVYTVKVDVFSFGAVLLEVIIGPYIQKLNGDLPQPFTAGIKGLHKFVLFSSVCVCVGVCLFFVCMCMCTYVCISACMSYIYTPLPNLPVSSSSKNRNCLNIRISLDILDNRHPRK